LAPSLSAASECRPEPQPISRKVCPATSSSSFLTPSTAKSMRVWSIFLEYAFQFSPNSKWVLRSVRLMLTLGSGRNLPMISPVVGLLLFLPACLSIKMILRQPAQPRVDGPDCCDSSAKSVVLAICTWLSRVAFNLSVLAREPSLGNGAAPLHSPERGTCD